MSAAMPASLARRCFTLATDGSSLGACSLAFSASFGEPPLPSSLPTASVVEDAVIVDALRAAGLRLSSCPRDVRSSRQDPRSAAAITSQLAL